MMKRTLTNIGPVLHDPATQMNHYVTVRKAPNIDTTRVVLHVSPAALVDPHEEETPRRAAEAKYFAIVSGILTFIVLWDILRQVLDVVPGVSSSPRAASLEESFTLDQINRLHSSPADSSVGGQKEASRSSLDFDFDASAVDSRRTATHLLEIPPQERFLVEQTVRRAGNLMMSVIHTKNTLMPKGHSGGYRAMVH